MQSWCSGNENETTRVQGVACVRYLLGHFCRLDLCLDDFQGDHVPGWFCVVQTFGFVADGKATFAKLDACGILDTERFADDVGRWSCMDGHDEGGCVSCSGLTHYTTRAFAWLERSMSRRKRPDECLEDEDASDDGTWLDEASRMERESMKK